MIPHSKPDLAGKDLDALRACFESGMINEGAASRRLEEAFCSQLGATAAIACGSGSQAIVLALKTLNVSAGDEVIIPSYVCAEVLASIESLGATPVIVDVEQDWLLDSEAAKAVICAQTKAIIVPYVMGIWRDFRDLAACGIPLVEDCAQYFPSLRSNHQGTLGVYSFEATKMITSGEGGLLVSLDPKFDHLLRAFKRFGDSPYRLNLYPLSDLLASVATSQLERLPELLARRRSLAEMYFERLADIPGLDLPFRIQSRSAFFRFPIKLRGHLKGRLDAVIAGMRQRGVTARRPVDLPLHRMRLPNMPCPNAEEHWNDTLSIPLYPALTDSEARTVTDALREVAFQTLGGRDGG